MKSKKMVSLLLAVVMILGLLPLSAMAAGTATKVGEVQGNTFTDETADPNKSYEYTVTGSDGSTQTITVPATSTEPTGNKITEQAGTGTVYYQKVTNPAKAKGEGYLLVDVNTSQAVSTRPGVEGVTIEGDRINGNHATAEWYVTKPSNGKLNFAVGDQSLTIDQTRSGEGKRNKLYKYSYKVVLGPKDGNNQQIHVDGETLQLSRTYYEPTRSWQTAEDYPVNIYLHIGQNGLDIVKSENSATAFTLYQKVTEPAGTQYVVDTTGLDALLVQPFNGSLYTPDSWQTYTDAKTAAETAKGNLNNPYTEKTAADAALADIDNVTRDLDAAIKGLTKKPVTPVEPGVCFAPEITWHRTQEPGNYREQPIENVQHLVDRAPWLNITWDWDQVKDLKASDPEPWNAKNGTAATWNKLYEGNWTDSSVRRFTGTFTWPTGVGMDGTMTIQSVNDSDYQFIYDYINADPDLKARYGNAKVLPINDDMYVFISKVSDGDPSTWSQAQASDHLMFWTGTSGKGIWSQHGSTGDDWGRKVPAQFEGKNATPAFHGSWPNLVDTGKGNNANVENWDLKGQPNPMAHTDNWYTLTDTNAMKSTLNDLYGAAANLAGEQMRIDIYAFDNSADGGMDKLMLTLCPAEKSDVQVTVNYWLDQIDGTLLGSSQMSKKVGDIVNLPNGTNSNELNYKKSEAIRQVGADTNVDDGVQQESNYKVVEGKNTINVVYKRDIKDMKYFTYDFGVQNQYSYKDENSETISRVSVECATDTIGASFSGHDITLTYTPQDAMGIPVTATLVVERRGNTNRYPVMFIPASNVLYEENFMKAPSDWTCEPNSVSAVSDNRATVFGWADAYSQSKGVSGAWTTTLAPQENSGILEFSFRGQGFDLIGSCDSNTSNLVVRIRNHNDAGFSQNYVVNTTFNGGRIDQVPLVHFLNTSDGGQQYDVSVAAVNVSVAPATLSAMGGPAIAPELYRTMTEMGMTDEEIMDAEYINMADELNADAPMLMSAAPLSEDGNQIAVVDGFRTYRASSRSAVAYPQGEQDVTYTNVLDTVQGGFAAFIEQNDLPGDKTSFTASTYERMGGPENEIYLQKNQSVAFAVDALKDGKVQISARAVTDDTSMKINNADNVKSITHNTEMYYEVNIQDGLVVVANTTDNLLALGNIKGGAVAKMSDEQTQQAVRMMTSMFAAPVEPDEPEIPAQFQINFVLTDGAVWTDGTAADQSFTLTADDGGLTAPAVKAPHGKKLVGWQAVEIDKLLKNREILTVQYLQENFDWTDKDAVITFQPVFEAEEGTAFEPTRFNLSTRASGLFHKRVTLTAKTSTDVAYLMVNGEKVTPTNARKVDRGFAKNYVFKVHQTVARKATATFNVVAYDTHGNASVMHTVTK